MTMALPPMLLPSRAPTRVDEQLPSWLLRAGLAFVFLYAGTAMVLRPEAFTKYVPTLAGGSATNFLLYVFAVYEVMLAVALLTRRHTYAASVAAVLTLAGITLANLDSFDVLFRNVAIACAAAALAVQSHRRRGARSPG